MLTTVENGGAGRLKLVALGLLRVPWFWGRDRGEGTWLRG